MRIGLPRGLAAGLVFAVSLGAASAAHAQHVVTEAEASKLTLEALTAPPPRPIYRAYVRRAMARSYVRESGWGRHGHDGYASSFSRVTERHMVRHGRAVVHARHHRR